MDALKSRGNEQYNKGKYKNALKYYQEAISESKAGSGNSSESAVLYSNKAMCYSKLGQWQDVIEECDVGIKMIEAGKDTSLSRKTLVKLLYRKGVALGKLNCGANEAIEVLNKALKLDATNSLVIKELQLIRGRELNNVVRDIKIVEVEQLPQKYRSLLADNERRDDLNDEKMEDAPIEELFSGQETEPKQVGKPKITVIEPEANDSNTPVRFLSDLHLLLISPALVSNYIRFLNVPAADFVLFFQHGGLDSIYLEYFVEASLAVLTERPSQFNSKIATLIITFATIKRFSLAVMLCDRAKIAKLFELLEIEDTWTE